MEYLGPYSADVDDMLEAFEQKALSGKVRAESMHPFDKDSFLSSLREQLNSFTSDMTKGYQAIAETAVEIGERGIRIAGIPALGKKSMRAAKNLFPTKEAISRACDPSTINAAVNGGVPLFEVLGLAPQTIANMYAISFYLLDQGRDEQANFAFRLLTVLAPYMADFWVGSGVALLRLNEYRGASEVLERALAIDPSSVQAPVLLCRALIQQVRRGEADARLNAKLDEAARKGDQNLYVSYDAIRYELNKFATGV
jgi:tetratricopeptide (TPR) repeat protein